jgi:prepilin-type N-terminal cleavage/methylation domain-containing protein
MNNMLWSPIKTPKKQQGFNLIEVLVVLVIISVLMMLGVPAMQEYFDEGEQRSSRDRLISAINSARVQSKAMAVPSYLCPSSDGSTCASAWAKNIGWIVYLDNNRSGGLNSGDEHVINISQGIANKVVISSANIMFLPNGITQATDFSLCSDLERSLDIHFQLNVLGRITFNVPNTNPCI